MIEEAWNEYRRWALRARELQAANSLWIAWTMVFAVLAATLGTIAGQAGGEGFWGRSVGFAAAACAAITPVLGKDMLAVGREAGWIRARVTAEALKSECYRFAAHAGDYSATDAADRFVHRRDEAVAVATQAGITPISDLVIGDDPGRPPDNLTSQWYLEHRVREQQEFYARRQADNEVWIMRLRRSGLMTALTATVLGTASSSLDFPALAPWIGVATTLGAMIVAHGLMERRQYLAATYAAMAESLGRVRGRFELGQLDLSELVSATEDLLNGEHNAWWQRVTKTIPAPPTATGSIQTDQNPTAR